MMEDDPLFELGLEVRRKFGLMAHWHWRLNGAPRGPYLEHEECNFFIGGICVWSIRRDGQESMSLLKRVPP